MVSIVPLQKRPEASAAASASAARSIFSLERRRREEDDGSRGPGGGMDLSGTQGELAIPMHASPYGGGGVGVGGHVLQQLHGRDHGGSNNNGQQSSAALTPSPPAAAEETESSGKKHGPAAGIGGASPAVKYRECLKNHAAAIGGNATDGCGEFMPSGEEGSLEALKCSACGCHRNFHRKEVDDDDDDDDVHGAADGFSSLGLGHGHGHRAAHRLLAPAMAHKSGGGGGLLISGADPYGAYAAARALPPALPPPPGHAHHHQYVMPLNMMHTSESDEMEVGVGGDAARGGGGSSSSRKRFRTKFTPEQKARMLEFAERVGWRLQRLDDGMVQAFCNEIGVKRRVLKVWMHNNKHNLATKRLEASPAAQEQQAMASPSPPPPPQQHMPLQMPAGVMPPPPPQHQHGGPSCHRSGPSSPLPLKLE